jgi:WD40 repeat protein
MSGQPSKTMRVVIAIGLVALVGVAMVYYAVPKKDPPLFTPLPRQVPAQQTASDATTDASAELPEKNGVASGNSVVTDNSTLRNKLGTQNLFKTWGRQHTGFDVPRRATTGALDSFVNNGVFSPDGSRFAVRTKGGAVTVHETKSGRIAWVRPIKDKSAKPATSFLALSNDGKRLAVGFDEQGVEIWDCDANRLVAEHPHKVTVSLVGATASQDEIFVTLPPGEAGNTDAPVGTYKISLFDGEMRKVPASLLQPAILRIEPLADNEGFLAIDAGLRVLHWNPQVDAEKITVLGSARFDIPATATNGFAVAKQSPQIATCPALTLIAANGQCLLIPTRTLLEQANAGHDPDSPPLLNSVGFLRETAWDMGEFPVVRVAPDQRRFLIAAGLVEVADFTLCNFPVRPSTANVPADYKRTLDISRDGKWVLGCDNNPNKSIVGVYEIGKVSDPPAADMHRWARKVIAENDEAQINAVLSVANAEKGGPLSWGVRIAGNSPGNSRWRQAVVGMLLNRWIPPWDATDASQVAAWKERSGVEFPEADLLAEDVKRAGTREGSFVNPAAVKKIVDAVFEKNATPKSIATFVEICPEAPPGLELLTRVASRAAEICPAEDPMLVDIANGLLEYDFEAPKGQPPIEATVGLIEQVAAAETARFGKDAGDIAYARFATAVANAAYRKFMTGRRNSLGPEVTGAFKGHQALREKIPRDYLDYERLSRGLRLYLQKLPDDYRVSRLALELGYEMNDKELARLAIPYFDNNPQLLKRPPQGVPNGRAYIEWAKAP